MITWFTSDLHFGHRNIISFCNRPFHDRVDAPFDGGPLHVAESAVEEMNESLVERWNAQVDDVDDVYILGDLMMGHLTDSITYVDRLNGHLMLTPGNHDRVFSGGTVDYRAKWHSTYADRMAVYPEQWQFLPSVTGFPVNVEVSHFPYGPAGDYDGRYADHHPEDRGDWLLHGHVHDLWRQRGRQINVGIDAWGGRLVSRPELVAMIEAGPQDLDSIPWRSDVHSG